VAWLTGNLDRFTPFTGRRIDGYHFKAFTELALAHVVLLDSGLHTPHGSTWKAFLLRHCDDPALAQMARKEPAIASAYLMPYLFLRSGGHRSRYYEETLAQLRRSGGLRRMELVPYRALEREYVLWRAGVVRSTPRWRALWRATSLGLCGSSLTIDDEAAYSVTHTLFYLTDFGRRRAPFTSSERSGAVTLTQALALHYWRCGHWDLLGECLLSLSYLDAADDEIHEAALDAFLNAWRPDGTIPSRARRRPKQDADRQFRDCYHTTLVGLLLAAGMARRA
jgi:hypothetical protein